MFIGKSGKVGAGRPSVLTPAEEKEIVVTCQVLQELGYGLTREIVTDVIHHFLKDQGWLSPKTALPVLTGGRHSWGGGLPYQNGNLNTFLQRGQVLPTLTP